MASKQTKKTEEVERELLEQIKSIWPQYSVSKQLLKNPTPAFTNEIFGKCLNELEVNCFLVFQGIHEERLDDLMSYCPGNIDRELFLYIHMKYIMEAINITYITLTDFYQTTNRTKLLMKIFLNLLFFIKRIWQEGHLVIQNINTAFSLNSESIERQRQIRVELSNVNEEIGEAIEDIDDLLKQKDNINTLKQEFEIRKAEELPQIEEQEREVAVLQVQLRELEEQIKSIDESNFELQTKVITEEEYNTMVETLKRLNDEAGELVKKEQETSTVFEEKRKNIRHLNQLGTMLDSVDLKTWDCIQELHDAQTTISTADSDNLERQFGMKRLEESIKRTETKIKQLNKQKKNEEKLMTKAQKDFEQKSVELEQRYKIEMENQLLLKNQAKLMEDNITSYKTQCKEAAKEIETIMEAHPIIYKNMLESYQRIKTNFDEKLQMIEDLIKKA